MLGRHLCYHYTIGALNLRFRVFFSKEILHAKLRPLPRENNGPMVQKTPSKMVSLLISGKGKVLKYQNTKKLRQPEIESRANAWKAFMLPLHHWRFKLAFSCFFDKKLTTYIPPYIEYYSDNPQTCNSNNHSNFYIIEENRYTM